MQNLQMCVSAVNIAGVPNLRITPNGDRWLHVEMHVDVDSRIRKDAKLRKEGSANSGVIIINGCISGANCLVKTSVLRR